mmetsp:Transcript_12249/g.28827  ORF Transcript_12249/g.28827 Transcript_12249/m.28827 type:complete len:278 (-) Transcript_12249:1006-1839(-)
MVWKPLPSGRHGLHHAARVELAHHDVVDEIVWLLDLVGLDATDEMGLGLFESLHQVVEGDSERVDDTDELGALEAACPGLELGLWFLFEEGNDKLVIRELHQDDQVLRQRVFVLLKEPGRVVGDLARVVVHRERVSVHTILGEHGILGMHLLHLLKPSGIRPVWEETLFRQQRQDAPGRILDELDHLCVVLVRHVTDFDALLFVLGKDGLEHCLRKHALQLLVRKIDAQLLKRIMRETFKPENIDSADEVARRTAEHERRVDRFDEHIEEPRVERLG